MPVPAALAAAPYILSSINILSNILGGGKERGREREVANLLREELARLPEIEERIQEVFEQRVGLLGAQRGRQVGELGGRIQQTVADITRGAGAASARAGFGRFGALEAATERQLGRELTGFEFGKQSIFDVFRERELQALTEREQQLSQLEQRRRDIETQLAGLGFGTTEVTPMRFPRAIGREPFRGVGMGISPGTLDIFRGAL